MDVSFKIGNEKFNYRVCAMIISDGKILAMHNERTPYYYLPGGRVKIGEAAENAVIREISEELGVTPKIVRPVWLNQAFFTEDVDKLDAAYNKTKKVTVNTTDKPIGTKRNKFNNFNQREYDYDQLEKVLLTTSVQ